MEKIDVAIQSYKKPESLIYTLLSLKNSLKDSADENCDFYIDTIWIDDDLSGEDTIKHYKDENFIKAMAPFKIKLRVNKKKVPPGCLVATYPVPSYFFKVFKNYLKALKNNNITEVDDIRYQWAINNTSAKKLFIIHDDILFKGNVVQKYFDTFKANPNLAIVGDLGQCWVCAYENMCSPEKIMQGKYPSEKYPRTARRTPRKDIFRKNFERACRINEWCCMIDVDKARKIKSHFGNYIDSGDVGAYWFEDMIKAGYDFADPLPTGEARREYYFHGWQGHCGNHVWTEESVSYKVDMINQKLLEDFSYKLNY